MRAFCLSVCTAARWGIPLALIALAGPARADEAALGPDGPCSGTGFANPGVVYGQSVTTTLSNADVEITLHRGSGESLVADVKATLNMDTPAVPAPAPLILVAFPITGLRRGATLIESFKVVVDRTEPPTVLRRYMPYPPKVLDAPVHGSLGSEWAAGTDAQGDPLLPTLADGTQYYDTYLWLQPANAGLETTVVITYKLVLQAQPLIYSKRYSNHDPDVVPFNLMEAGDGKEKAFFFDYILRPAATWMGFVGHETITLDADKDLGLDFQDLRSVILMEHHAVPYEQDDTSRAVSLYRSGGSPDHIHRESDGIRWELNHLKPATDILFEIPERAVMGAKPE